MNFKILLICFLYVSVETLNECVNQTTCSYCIRSQDCVWVNNNPVSKTTCSYCIRSQDCVWVNNNPTSNATTKTGCYPLFSVQNYSGNLYNPQSSVEVIQNSSLNENVKVSPQAIKLQLRLNAPVNFTILTHPNEELKISNSTYLNSLNITVNLKQDTNAIIATIEALSCPRNQNQTHETIYLTTTRSQYNIKIEIELLCECPYKNANQIVPKAPECHYSGSYQCGKCSCDELTYEEFWECRKEKKIESCTHKGQICSDRGVCICGFCKCIVLSDPNKIIYGKYCECDNFSCPYKDGQLCSGPNHGECSCGVCECLKGWSGKDCSIKI